MKDTLTNHKFCGMSEEQFNRFKKAYWATYSAISCDCEGVSDREMIELVCDADRLLTFGEPCYGKSKVKSDFPDFYKTVVNPMLDKYYGTVAFDKMMKFAVE